MPNPTIQSELELFKKTGNSTHARWVANELIKAQADSKFANIEKQLDVTVGHASGGDIKSGLLWAVLDLATAGERKLRDELEKRKKSATGIMLHGVLNMPPELWGSDQLDQAQRHSKYIEASEILNNQAQQIAIMKEALMEIRNRGRHWPDAGEMAANALDKTKAVNQ